MRRKTNHFVHHLCAINDGLFQVRDPEKDASVNEHDSIAALHLVGTIVR